MNQSHLIGSIAVFIAALFLVQGLADLWNSFRGRDARRLGARLDALRRRDAPGGRGQKGLALARAFNDERSRVVDEFLAQLPRYGSLEASLRQAGSDIGAGRFVVNAAILALLAGLAGLMLQGSYLVAAGCALAGALLPFAWLRLRCRRRRHAFERQLPDAIDLIGRALRAGHAFTPSLQMVAEELDEPIAGEFRQAADEIAFGIPVNEALVGLARRMPLDDLRFFVIATLLQRETGGNLAEILDNISRLVRERFKLLGQVRVLTAEGRLSAWILTLLPFGTALMMHVVNPDFMTVLFKDPFGLKLVIVAAVAMVAGIVWMWRLVQIRP